MLTRRQFLLGAGASVASGLAFTGYAFGVEPMYRLDVAEYRLISPSWPSDFPLTIAVVADVHAIDPWMTAERIAGIANFTNTLGADIVLLAGDYETGLAEPFRRLSRAVSMERCAEALARLRAPLGVHAVLGNHDMEADEARAVKAAFLRHHIPILENRAVRIVKDGRPFWLLGIGDQMGHWARPGIWTGYDDLPGTLDQVTDDAPAILLAHEPDIFPKVPERVALTICGHTHGGQVALPFYGPLVAPFRYGRRYVYGHVREGRKDMIISAGLGMSIAPVRFGRPPEIVLIRLGQAAAVA
jgi:predicted MPP superfamily phosphohydrolase